MPFRLWLTIHTIFLSLQPSPAFPVPRPIARITTWCHNALVGRIYPQGIIRAGYFRRSCEAQGTSPSASVSNIMSGQRLGSSRQPAEPSGRTRGWPERQAVSDWASALSWGRDEAELVSELQAGSETAFDWLVTHYHGPVYNLILGMLGDTSDAADAAQEVFLKAFRGIRNFRQGSSLKTWLYRIAIREALNQGAGSSAICRKTFRSTLSPKRARRKSKLKISPPRLSISSLRTKFKWPCRALCSRFPTFFAARSSCATSKGSATRKSPKFSIAASAR